MRSWLALTLLWTVVACHRDRSQWQDPEEDPGTEPDDGDPGGDPDDDDPGGDPDAGLPPECDDQPKLALGHPAEGRTRWGCSTTDPGCSTSVDRPDALYAIEHPEGLLTVVLDSSFDAVLELRAELEEPTPEYCTDLAFADGREIAAACVAAGTTWALVDGHGSGDELDAPGPFSIAASLEVCGRGETCRPELPACASKRDPGDTCGAAVALEPDATVLARFAGLEDDLAPGCSPASRPDGVFSIDVPAAGELSFDVWDPAFQVLPSAFLYGDCGDAASELACGVFGAGRACLAAGTYALAVEGEGDGELAVQTRFHPCAAEETCQRGACLPPLTEEPEPNDDPDDAPELAGGSWIAASLDPSTEVDWYRVHVPAGGTVAVSTVSGCDADTVVMLLADYRAALPGPGAHACDEANPHALLDCADDAEGTLCGRVQAEADVWAARDVLVRVNRHSLERDDPAPGLYVLQVTFD
jgi:hypothetical protein